jgi:1,2-diacylglycerol 3-beta-galactosyltransferase
MHNPSALATNQEPGPAFDLVTQLGGFTFNKAVQSINSSGFSLGKSNYIFLITQLVKK